MSFLIRRNLPLAWAGYFDNFARPVENPIQQPWFHIGDGTPASLNELEEMHIPANYATIDGGGESYAWQPFTPNWGFEYELWWPVEGIAAQQLGMYFTDSWTKVAPNKFEDAVGVQLFHNIGGDKVRYAEFENTMAGGTNFQEWNPPVGFFGNTLTLRVWCENDEWVRIWLNGTYIGSKMISPGYRLGPTRRCIRFCNAALCGLWIRWTDHYDRPPTVPPKSVWTSLFYDDFNRADGSVGNGWTQLGTDAGIVSNRYTHTGTNTNSVGLIRNVGNLDGRARIECVVRNPSGIDGSLMLFCNAAGDQALVANVFNNHVYLGRMTSSVNGTPTFFDFQDGDVTINDGDTLAFTVYDEISWLEVNGVPKLYAGNVHNVVPHTNTYAGLRVRRDGSDSVKFDDVRIYSGVGV